MRIPIGFMLTVATLAASPAAAEPYRIAYEGNDFPENEGWLRVTTGGGAERTLEDGVLTLDGLASVEINDAYSIRRPGLDPGFGEYFWAEWRLRIDEPILQPDPSIAIFSDEGFGIGLTFSSDRIVNGYNDDVISFAFSDFHEFRVVSGDMRHFQLIADGAVIYESQLSMVASTSRVSWGDGVAGVSSRTSWDYMRFGVVPEPPSATVAIVALLLLPRRPNRA